jgi:hypothetical protein
MNGGVVLVAGTAGFGVTLVNLAIVGAVPEVVAAPVLTTATFAVAAGYFFGFGDGCKLQEESDRHD